MSMKTDIYGDGPKTFQKVLTFQSVSQTVREQDYNTRQREVARSKKTSPTVVWPFVQWQREGKDDKPTWTVSSMIASRDTDVVPLQAQADDIAEGFRTKLNGYPVASHAEPTMDRLGAEALTEFTRILTVNIPIFASNKSDEPDVLSLKDMRKFIDSKEPTWTAHTDPSTRRISISRADGSAGNIWATQRRFELLSSLSHQELPAQSRPTKKRPITEVSGTIV
jgi:hypothetical protein